MLVFLSCAMLLYASMSRVVKTNLPTPGIHSFHCSIILSGGSWSATPSCAANPVVSIGCHFLHLISEFETVRLFHYLII